MGAFLKGGGKGRGFGVGGVGVCFVCFVCNRSNFLGEWGAGIIGLERMTVIFCPACFANGGHWKTLFASVMET